MLLVEHRLEREALSALIDQEPTMRAAAAPSLPFALRLLAERGSGHFVALIDANLVTDPVRELLLESGPEVVLLLHDPNRTGPQQTVSHQPGTRSPSPALPGASPRVASVCRDTPWYSIRKLLLASSPDLATLARLAANDGQRPNSDTKCDSTAASVAESREAAATPPNLFPSAEDDRKLASLTRRERQVLELIAGGGSVKEGAASLHIAVSTFDNHKSRLMKKVGVRKSSELIRFAFRLGLAP